LAPPFSKVDNCDSDSDEDSSNEDSVTPVKMKYELNYVVDFAGGRKKTRRKTRKSRKCRKSRK
jgi:hypothetical protein